MSMRLAVLALLGLLTVLRWLWLAPQELSPSSAYLALCGSAPSIAYFDGPGATAVCVALGTQIAGAGALGAALFWPVMAALATFALYRLVLSIGGERPALASAVLLNLLPVFNGAAVSPSCALPVGMFALGFAACAWRALETSSLAWWLAAGLCAAGGLLFAYLAWFFLPALLLILLLSHRWRGKLFEPGFWLAAVPPLVVFVLLLAWNAGHGWVHFIGGTWQTASAIDLRRVPAAVFQAAVGASPVLLPLLAAALLIGLRAAREAPRAKFLAIPAALAAIIAIYLALRGAPAQAAGLTAALLALPLLGWVPVGRSALAVVFFTAALWASGFMWLQPTARPYVTAEVTSEIESLRQKETTDPAAPVFLIAHDAALASVLALHLADTSFAAPGHPPVYVLESPCADSQYALWPRYDQFIEAPAPAPGTAEDPFTEQKGINPFLARSALYITPQTPEELPQAITAAFAAHRLLAEITTPSGQILRVYLCSSYETLPL